MLEDVRRDQVPAPALSGNKLCLLALAQALSCLPCPCLCRACRRALDGELYFYGQVLGFQPNMPADFQPIDIANI
jgi:hypothetical protein